MWHVVKSFVRRPQARRRILSLSHTKLLSMRFCLAVESQCVVSTQIVPFVHGPKARRRILQPVLFRLERVASGKHVAQTADQSAQTSEKVD